MKKLLKKYVYGSYEQCTGPTGVTHSCEIFEVVGHMHCSARNLLATDSTVSHVKRILIKKKKKRKTRTQHKETQSKRTTNISNKKSHKGLKIKMPLQINFQEWHNREREAIQLSDKCILKGYRPIREHGHIKTQINCLK